MTQPGEGSSKLWGGRFSGETDALVEAFNASIDFDRRLYAEDIEGSIAHAGMLAAQGIISTDDRDTVIAGLEAIRAEIDAGTFAFRLDREDIHLNIEAALIERVGDAGRRLHTARSRNDQVATDTRLHTRAACDAIVEALRALRAAFLDLAEREAATAMPGYTHLQRAQPILLAHHLQAYEAMLARDTERFTQARARANVLPLGAGALAGVTYPIDREAVARALGFDAVAENSSTPSPTVTSSWTSTPPPPSRWCTCRGSLRRSSSGLPPSSASCASTTATRPGRASCRRRRTRTSPN